MMLHSIYVLQNVEPDISPRFRFVIRFSMICAPTEIYEPNYFRSLIQGPDKKKEVWHVW